MLGTLSFLSADVRFRSLRSCWESGSWLVGNNMGRSSAIWVMGSGWVRPFTKPILVAIGPWAAMGLVYLWAGVFFRFRGMFTGFEFLRVFFVST